MKRSIDNKGVIEEDKRDEKLWRNKIIAVYEKETTSKVENSHYNILLVFQE